MDNERNRDPQPPLIMPMRPGGGPGGPVGPGRGGSFGPKVKPKNTKEVLRRLWGYLQRQRARLATVFVLVLGASVLNLVGPYLIGQAIDTMVGGAGAIDFGRLVPITLTLLSCYGAAALLTWFHTYLMAEVAQVMVRQLRDDLFAKLQTLSLRFFDRQPHGQLMSRLTNDVENVNNSLNQSVVQVFTSMVTVTGSLLMMLWLNPLLTLLSLIVIPMGTALTGFIMKRTRDFFTGQQKELGDLNGYIEETISGQRVIKAFGREEVSLAHFDAINRRLNRVGVRAQIFAGVVPPLMNVVNNLSFAIVAAAGGWMAIRGLITVGVIASFLNYSKQFARPINELANQFNLIQAAVAGAERVFEVMDETPEIADRPDAEPLKSVAGSVAFQDVSFGYQPQVPVLREVSLRAEPGQTIALVGPTGAGKTTIVNLLTRFYDIDQGAILIDGREIRAVRKNDLRRSLGIVLQDSYLFAATVRENIRYGRLDASDAEVDAAARIANAEPFIRQLPDGYDTVLTEDGGNLSQGQRQLLTIARAILADPAILILDEATSSVDTRTEMHIQQAMLGLMKGRTSFVIAHRLSTIREADQILVIDGGRIVERGNHQQLLQAKGFYYNLYQSQFRGEAI